MGFTVDHTIYQKFSVSDFRAGVVPLKNKSGCHASCFKDYVADGDKLGSMLIEACDGVRRWHLLKR